MPITIDSIPVTDSQRAKRFYMDVMDFKLLRESPMGPGMNWIQLQPRDGGNDRDRHRPVPSLPAL